jgi:hypothetical protein
MALDGSGIDGGSNEGLVLCNDTGKKSEPLVTVQKLRDTYLFGVNILDANGNTPNDAFFQQAIDTAVSYFEHLLDISISPVINHVEYKDYHLNDYAEWGSILLSNYPVIQVRSMKMVYFRDANGLPVTVQEIPKAWIRLQRHDGLIRLIPNTRFPSQLQISETGSFFPEILRATEIPHLWQFVYDYGFETGKVPILLNQAIGLFASILCLIPAGHLVIGAGVAATSISMDGLSQSLQTTASAENSAFSATIKDYSNRLFGQNSNDPKGMVNILIAYYKSTQMNII